MFFYIVEGCAVNLEERFLHLFGSNSQVFRLTLDSMSQSTHLHCMQGSPFRTRARVRSFGDSKVIVFNTGKWVAKSFLTKYDGDFNLYNWPFFIAQTCVGTSWDTRKHTHRHRHKSNIDSSINVVLFMLLNFLTAEYSGLFDFSFSLSSSEWFYLPVAISYT